MITTEKIKLSASKIKTAEGCSWLYYTKYVLKLPDISNSGASRGTICHLILKIMKIENKDEGTKIKKLIT